MNSGNKNFELAAQSFQLGQLDKAKKICRKALLTKPNSAKSSNLMGMISLEEGDSKSAVEWYKKAVAAKADYAEAHNNLGVAFLIRGNLDESVESFQRAVSIQPNYARALGNLSAVLKDCGRIDDSILIHRKSLAMYPAWNELRSSLLLTRHYEIHNDPLLLLEDHLKWDNIHAGHLSSVAGSHGNSLELGRRLRIGLVSPDLRDHPVIRFLIPFLKSHDKSVTELFVYSQVIHEDLWTDLSRKYVDHWRSISKLTDTQAAELIRNDEIDILIDLAGHTDGNRLLVFVHRPAPLQISWLGYPGTTGLAAMDYRVTDDLADPIGMTESNYSEELIRHPNCAWCYNPDSELPVTQSPAKLNKFVTFGCFNNFAKINDNMLMVWARILSAVPKSRLLLKSSGIQSYSARQKVKNVFVSAGVDPNRLDFRGPEISHELHLAIYGEIDIALDTYPYHGTTTTCEALWMGVPVVTLAGNTHASRVGASLLFHAGLSNLVAESEDEYVQIAAKLAENQDHLFINRPNLREKLQSSELLDATSHSKGLEMMFRKIWVSWVTKS